ncbi:unnamed protein product [Closterium sp. NIES-65]|nr:unnamed protein product [Closterium sp. NIES-65]
MLLLAIPSCPSFQTVLPLLLALLVMYPVSLCGTERANRFESVTRLVFLPDNEYNSKCLDGSTPAYYFRAGAGAGRRKWHVHLPQGGWCFSPLKCRERANSPLGSSRFWATHLPAVVKNGGKINNHWPAAACAGEWRWRVALESGAGEWRWRVALESGTGEWRWRVALESGAGEWRWRVALEGGAGEWRWRVTLESGAGEWRWRVTLQHWLAVLGIRVVSTAGRAPITGQRNQPLVPRVEPDLCTQRGMGAALHVLFSGSSAGGHAIIMHCDRLAAAFPHAKATCLANSGFFVDAKDRFGVYSWREYIQQLTALHLIEVPKCPAGKNSMKIPPIR